MSRRRTPALARPVATCAALLAGSLIGTGAESAGHVTSVTEAFQSYCLNHVTAGAPKVADSTVVDGKYFLSWHGQPGERAFGCVVALDDSAPRQVVERELRRAPTEMYRLVGELTSRGFHVVCDYSKDRLIMVYLGKSYSASTTILVTTWYQPEYRAVAYDALYQPADSPTVAGCDRSSE